MALSPRNGSPPGQGLVEDGPGGEEVGPRVHGVAEDLLGGHVARGPDDEPRAREIGGRGESAGDVARQLAGQAEVEELGAVGRQEDVRGLEVPVHDTRVVQGAQGRQHVLGDVHRLGGRQRLPPQPGGEGLAGQQLHGEKRPPALLADVEDGAHVGMADPCRGAGLAEEPAPRGPVAAASGSSARPSGAGCRPRQGGPDPSLPRRSARGRGSARCAWGAPAPAARAHRAATRRASTEEDSRESSRRLRSARSCFRVPPHRERRPARRPPTVWRDVWGAWNFLENRGSLAPGQCESAPPRRPAGAP